VLKIDCSQDEHSHEIAKLIGAPPGYLGHGETQALLSPFDEIEKASDSLLHLLLGFSKRRH
jgi:ATP-dependent Clp protease ATP-binding subunit ClpA